MGFVRTNPPHPLKDKIPEDADEYWWWLNHHGWREEREAEQYVDTYDSGYNQAIQDAWKVYDSIHAPEFIEKQRSEDEQRNGKSNP